MNLFKKSKFTKEEETYLENLRKKNEILEVEVKFLDLSIKKAQMQSFIEQSNKTQPDKSAKVSNPPDVRKQKKKG